jgi:methylenetetrahydrofolate dehydrogenase (NADP+)/methenyltetrahydrofolate cyclohydrolase
MQYINCKQYAQEILDEVKALPNKKTLAILTVGDNPASQSYVKGKIKDCEYCGVPYTHIQIKNSYSAGSELHTHINLLNLDGSIGGIIVQLPLPNGFNEELFTHAVRLDKDVDGFRPESPFEPCTPEGIMYLLRKELGDLAGLRALVIGRGKLVGEPIAKMLLDENCTVTIAHSKTHDLDSILGDYDIIISAVGKAGLVDLRLCREAKVVIDVGVNRNAEGKLCGDCYGFFTSDDGPLVTPVPGGIGLMTRAMLMKHMGEV